MFLSPHPCSFVQRCFQQVADRGRDIYALQPWAAGKTVRFYRPELFGQFYMLEQLTMIKRIPRYLDYTFWYLNGYGIAFVLLQNAVFDFFILVPEQNKH
jgi:hypothetical protein